MNGAWNHIVFGLKYIGVGLALLWGSLFGSQQLGTATVTTGNSYPTSSYSFSDNDIINAGDLNNFSTYMGIRSATDTASLQGQIYNASTIANAPPVGSATGILPVSHGGTGTSTAPSDSQILSASGTMPAWKNLLPGIGVSITTSTNSITVSAGTNITMMAGEAINNGALVAINGASSTLNVSQKSVSGLTNFQISSTTLIGQTFLTSPNAVGMGQMSVLVSAGTSTNVAIELDLYLASGTSPTGSILASSSYSSSTWGGSQFQEETFNFPTSSVLSISTTYFALFKQTNNATSAIGYDTGNPYANGSVSTSTNSGTNWTNNSDLDFYFTDYETVNPPLVYMASAANSSTARYTGLFGVANASTTIQSIATVITAGSVSETGLTAGTEYYLGNANGTMNTAPGSTSLKIGVAISSSTLLLRIPNP